MGEPAPIEACVSVRGLVNEPLAGTFILRIQDFSGNVVRQEEIPAINWTGSRCTVNLTFMAQMPGSYLTKVNFKTGQGRLTAQAEANLVYVRPPEAAPAGTLPFCGVEGANTPGLARIGNKWQGHLFHWKQIEAQPGQYTWPDLGQAKAEGFRLKLTLGHLPSTPEWAWNPQDVADCRAKGLKPRFGFLPAPEHIVAWRAFITKMAEQYRDLVEVWEIGGEDDLTFGKNPYYLAKYPEHVKGGLLVGGPAYEMYAEMVRLACLEIKKAIPGAKVGIVRPSGVDCTDVKPRFQFSAPVIRHCAEVFDFFPLDCYCFPRYLGAGQRTVALPEDFLPDDFREAGAVCDAQGRGQNIFVSEFGYALDFNAPADSDYAKEMVKRLARTFLLARLNPRVKMIHWFHTNGCIEGGIYHYGLWRFGQPLPTVAAYATVSRVVENVRQVREVDLGQNAKAAVFSKSGSAQAAVWMLRGKGKLANLKLPAGLQIYNVVGATTATRPEAAGAALDLDEFPIYLELAGQTAGAELEQLLASAVLVCNPAKIRLLTPHSNEAVLQIRNMSAGDLTAQLQFKVGENGESRQLSLKRGETQALPLALPGGHSTPALAVEVRADYGSNFETDRQIFPVEILRCKKMTAPIKVDGDLADWTGRDSLTLADRSQILPPDPWIDWSGPQDLSARLHWGWDEQNFYLAAEVKDDAHFNRNPAEQIYGGDCLQIAFDPLANAGGVDSLDFGYEKDDFDLGFALTDSGPAAGQWSGDAQLMPACRYAVKRDEAKKTTVYEVAIPFAALKVKAQPRMVFGFNAVLFDDDTGGGQNYWLQLAPGIAGGKLPALFKKLALE